METPSARKAGKAAIPKGEHAGLLEAVGVTCPEQRLYRLLLRQPGATAAELSRETRQPLRSVQRLLVLLEAKGMVTHLPERVRRYLPAPPDIAVEALIVRRQEELQRSRLAIASLQEETHKEGRGGERQQQVVEMQAGPVSARSYQQMQKGAQSEMLCLVRPPFYSSSAAQVDEQRVAATRRGVRYRSIYDPEVLEMPGWLSEVRRGIEAGEQVRVLPRLPGKLIIADRRIGLLPLDLRQSDGPVLLVRPSSLLDALCELFELLWQRSVPISFGGDGALAGTPSLAPGDEEERLVTLLAAGLNDKAISHELDISSRTLNRRLFELQSSLNAQTRFQAGWQAALRHAARQAPRPGED